LKIIIAALFVLLSFTALSQQYSFVTDLSVLRNFSPNQKFWSIGQNFQANINISKKESAYIGFAYFRNGSFRNYFLTHARSSSTTPQDLPYKVTGTWGMREISLGWKHYFKGAYDAEEGWNLYGVAGFGFMYARVNNTYNTIIDTTLYMQPLAPASGNGKLNRLTFDLGLGYEYPMGGNFFIYGEGKTWLPASNYPSPYLHSNRKVPFPVIASLGIRILFGY